MQTMASWLVGYDTTNSRERLFKSVFLQLVQDEDWPTGCFLVLFWFTTCTTYTPTCAQTSCYSLPLSLSLPLFKHYIGLYFLILSLTLAFSQPPSLSPSHLDFSLFLSLSLSFSLSSYLFFLSLARSVFFHPSLTPLFPTFQLSLLFVFLSHNNS